MAQFLADIAGVLELFAVAAGLVVLYLGRERGAALLKTAGYLLIVGGIAAGLCTSYYWVRYQVQGGFDQPYPHPIMRHGMPMMGMMGGMHGSGPMHGGPGMGKAMHPAGKRMPMGRPGAMSGAPMGPGAHGPMHPGPGKPATPDAGER